MHNTHGTGLRHLALALLLIAGCNSQSDSGVGTTEDTDVLCPSCGATAGGETGDFGPSLATCADAYAKREIDASEAEALGYAADAIRAIEEPIDEAMTWAVIDSEGGGPARGYDEETEVHLTLSVDALTLHERDLDKCDNDDCRMQAEEGICPERFIMVSASGELHTSDGAITATLPTQDVRMLRPDDDDFGVAASVNLRDVTGNLQLEPTFPEPRIGRLDLSLQYTRSGEIEYGVIDIAISTDWDKLLDDDGVPPAGAKNYRYGPLQGRWGSPPTMHPSIGGPSQP